MERGNFRRKGILYEPFYNGIGIRNKSAFWKGQKDNLAHLRRLALWKKLDFHDGCVNSIVWNEAGTRLLSASDDHRLIISDPFTSRAEAVIQSGHRANIFSANFFPSSDDRQIVSCCGSGEIMYTLVDREDTWGKNVFNCHLGTTYDVATIQSEPHTFLSCGEDNTVRFFDLRVKTSCNKRNCQDDVLIRFRRGVTAISINPRQSYYLATGSSDSIVRIFDRRMISAPRSTADFSSVGVVALYRAPGALPNSPITCVKFADDGCECLVSYSGDQLYLFSIKETVKMEDATKFVTGAQQSLPAAAVSSPTSSGSTPQFPLSSLSLLASQQQQQSVKRLRLRGDWSDTGPLARPESERRHHPPATIEEEREQRFYTTMQRVSDMLTNWLVNYMNRQQSPAIGGVGASSSTGTTGETSSSSNSSRPCLPPALAPVATLLAAAGGPSLVTAGAAATAGPSSSPQRQRNRSRTNSLTANSNNNEAASRNRSRLGGGDEDDGDDDGDDNDNENDEEADEDESSGTSSHSLDDRSHNNRRSSDETGGDDDEQRTLAAMRVQRYFRLRAKEKKRQQREWGQIPQCRQLQRYDGHRSVRTMIKEANFWGDKYVISGSDCGHVFFWDRQTGRIVNVIEADRHVVNCVQPHQHLPLLATSGIDYDIKLFSPILPSPAEDIDERAAEIARRNAVMLEEGRDTLTVPASFMLRVLAAFNHLGSGGVSAGDEDNSNSNNNNDGASNS